MDANTVIDLADHVPQDQGSGEDDPLKIARQTEVRAAKMAIMDMLPEKCSGRILDIGSAAGWGALELQRRYGDRVSCVVPFEHERLHLSKLGFNTELAVQEQLPPHWEATFAIVRASHVLEHSVAPVLAVREYARVLRPGGTCQIVMPEPRGYTGLGTERPRCVGTFALHCFCASQETVSYLLQRAGLTVKLFCEVPTLDNGRLQYYHRVWLAKKECSHD